MNNIEKDQKTLINSSRAAEAILKERLGGMNQPTQQPANNNNQSNQNQQNNQQTKQENFLFRKDSVYSVVYEQYINEADGVKITNPDGSSNGGNNTNNQQSAANTANNNTQTNPASGNNLKNNTNRNVDMNHDTDNKQQSDDKLGKEDIQSLDKKIQIYNSVCSAVLTAKMTAVTIIYKAYMTIIKKHVKDYVGGSDNTADNTMAKTGTDYSNKQVQLTNAQKSDIEGNIAQAEQETDESKKLDLQKAAIESLRKADSNFKGGYEAVKLH
jgi:ABC-type cobalt transport system substrate-binding protein